MGREVNHQHHEQQQQLQKWLKNVETFCEVCFPQSLSSCCWSNLGLAQPQSRKAAHKVTERLPVCSSLLYWKWTFCMASSKVILSILLVVSPKNVLPIIGQ